MAHSAEYSRIQPNTAEKKALCSMQQSAVANKRALTIQQGKSVAPAVSLHL